MRASSLLPVLLLLAACAAPPVPEAPRGLTVVDGNYEGPIPAPFDPDAGAIVIRTGPGGGVTASALPAGTEAGEITVTLGSPDEPGLWAASDLYSEPRRVRLTHAASGRSVELEMRPTTGYEQLSLEGYQALNLSPAEILVLEVQPL